MLSVKPGHLRRHDAGAAHDQVDLHAGCCPAATSAWIERLVGQRVHLQHDARRLAGLRAAAASGVDALDQLAVQCERRQPAARSSRGSLLWLARCRNTCVHVGRDARVGREVAEVGVQLAVRGL